MAPDGAAPPREWRGLVAASAWPRLRVALTVAQRSELHCVLSALPAETRPRVISELLGQLERMPFGSALFVALSRAARPGGDGHDEDAAA